MIAELQTAISQVPSRKARLKGLTQVESVRIKVERAAAAVPRCAGGRCGERCERRHCDGDRLDQH